MLHIRHVQFSYANNGANRGSNTVTMTMNQIPTGPFALGPIRNAAANVSINGLCPTFKKLLEVSFSAGVVDGEGCILFSKTTYPGRKNPSYRLVLSISQNNHKLLVRVARALDVPPRLTG